MNSTKVKVTTAVLSGSLNLVGCLKDTPIKKGFYIANDAFWNAESVTGGVTVPAFRCYIDNSTIKARTLTFHVSDGTATGVTMIQKVGDLVQDGKYIQDNRIVILKDGKKFNTAGQSVK